MSAARREKTRVALALAAAFAAFLVAGQAAADTVIPPTERTATPRLVGQAGWSYLSGLRTFAAAVMWNRIEPIFHSYYRDVPLDEQRYMLPWVAFVTALDPSLLDPWYVGSWIVARNGRVEEGIALARKGMESNPRSGLLAASYAQMLYLFKRDARDAVSYARRVLEPQMTWRSLQEQYEAYAVVREILRASGFVQDSQRVEALMRDIARRIDAGEGAASTPDAHDGGE